MARAWVLTGETGEYSDWTTWIVAVYTTEAAAEAHRAECQRVADAAAVSAEARAAINKTTPRCDPRMKVDYAGTNYYVAEVEADNLAAFGVAAPTEGE